MRQPADPGLELRGADPADIDALVAFNADIHRPAGAPAPSQQVAHFIRDLLGRPHPAVRLDDVLVVVERASGAIVASLLLITQTWRYDGLPFEITRVEYVGTRPDYRGRGLIRLLLDEAHRRSAERGQLVQVIGGIPNFYRQFGYEYALSGGAEYDAPAGDLPQLADSERLLWLRPATEADTPVLAEADAAAARHALVTVVHGPELWRYELRGRSADNPFNEQIALIVDHAGVAAGAVRFWPSWSRPMLVLGGCQLLPGRPWMRVAPSVLDALRRAGEERFPAGAQPFAGLRLALGDDHPLYRLTPCQAAGGRRSAWYVRVPDVAAFLRHVAPVIERRLAESLLAGFSGELPISFYHGGLRLVFADGRLHECVPTPDLRGAGAGAAFPGLTFLQIVFGYRSLADIEHAFPDCQAPRLEHRRMLEAIFPAGPAQIWSPF